MSEKVVNTEDYVALLKEGSNAWNAWRVANPSVSLINLEGAELQGLDLLGVDLSGVNLGWASLGGTNLGGADLRGVDLTSANVSGANLGGANLAGANLFKAVFREAKLYRATLPEVYAKRANFYKADFSHADLHGANFVHADLQGAKFHGANLADADLERAVLGQATLNGADLRGANLSGCRLIEVALDYADISGCRVYGTSAWDVSLDGTQQSDLVITPEGEAEITVDDLEVAQFVYLFLNNAKIRKVVDNISSKLVLILGRFSDERKPALDSMRQALRAENYVPVLFDWDKPDHRDLTETVGYLAHMARFVIADITSPRSIPQELERIVKDLPSVPVQPIICSDQDEYAMVEHYDAYPWFLELFRYKDVNDLAGAFASSVLAPAENFLKRY